MVESSPKLDSSNISGQLRLTERVARDFQYSFGIWTTMGSFLDPVVFLTLQLLSSYFYRVAISRVQTKLRVVD